MNSHMYVLHLAVMMFHALHEVSYLEQFLMV